MDKFLEADLHFILAHPHQGAKIKQLGWDMVRLGDNLQRLYYHVGFPRAGELRCPIFLQDKYEYLHVLGSNANPTMRIFLNKNHDYSSLHEEILRYKCTIFNVINANADVFVLIQVYDFQQ